MMEVQSGGHVPTAQSGSSGKDVLGSLSVIGGIRARERWKVIIGN